MTRTGYILDRAVYWGLMGQILLLPLAHVATVLTVVTVLTLVAFIIKAPAGAGSASSPPPWICPSCFSWGPPWSSTFYSVDRFETLDQIRSDVVIPMANFYLAAWGLGKWAELRGISRASVVIVGVLAGFGIIHFFVQGGRLDS